MGANHVNLLLVFNEVKGGDPMVSSEKLVRTLASGSDRVTAEQPLRLR